MHLRLHAVDFRYTGGAFRLAPPNLEIEPGQHIAFTGPSGSGKTTLLRLLAGIHTPQEGRVELDGDNAATWPDARRRAFRIQHIGFIFQDFRLLDYLDLRENILLPYRLNPALRLAPTVHERLEELAKRLSITPQLTAQPGALSQGEKQRGAIARALLPTPRLLLADEPTGNLDAVNTSRTLTLLQEEARHAKATLLMVTHDHALLEHFDRVINFSNWIPEATTC
ncbi:MAG: ABC transporter ATP-binding protein [Verrucomicrobiota bacterium]|nr:ABC transporter ATP-binding protein [Verrucomicrobiota bacterium]